MPVMADAAYAANAARAGKVDAVAGYLPSGNAYHVWSPADWAGFAHVKRQPIWVAGSAAAEHEAWTAIGWLKELGAPPGPVVIDLETRVDPLYVHVFTEVLDCRGYWGVPYGSTSTIYRNPRRGGYWVAKPGPCPASLPAGVNGIQYGENLRGGAYDLSLISAGWLRHMW